MRNAEILAVVLAVLLGALVVGCEHAAVMSVDDADGLQVAGAAFFRVPMAPRGADPEPTASPACCVEPNAKGECDYQSSIGCFVGPVPPRKGRRAS